MNFLLPNYLGDYKEFQTNIIRPIHRSFTAQRTLSEDMQLIDNKIKIENKSLYRTIDISSNGLQLLRNLHKQVLYIWLIYILNAQTKLISFICYMYSFYHLHRHVFVLSIISICICLINYIYMY